MNRAEKQNLRTGLLFTSPWIIGFLAFCAYPVASSVYYSLCDYSVLSPAVFVGARNYSNLFSDAVFWKALCNTLFFAVFAIPTGLAVSLFLAILLNFNVAGRSFFRTAIFLPSLVPMVSLAVLWQWILNGRLGLLNCAISPVLGLVNRLSGLALTAPNWLQDAHYAKWGLVFASVWGVGNAVVIYLAALQDVPRHLYESAEIDGANFWSRTVHITLPVISPVIYFNTIMGLIGSLQVFAVPYVMTGGGDGPERSLLFVTTYLFQNAFEYWNMGYACAIGLILFLVILLCTILATRLSERHIYYAGK